MVEPTLCRFTFDQHLRDKRRTPIPPVQFCAFDLTEAQGLGACPTLMEEKHVLHR